MTDQKIQEKSLSIHMKIINLIKRNNITVSQGLRLKRLALRQLEKRREQQ